MKEYLSVYHNPWCFLSQILTISKSFKRAFGTFQHSVPRALAARPNTCSILSSSSPIPFLYYETPSSPNATSVLVLNSMEFTTAYYLR
ncbi:hypothetical protein KY285_011271 [Solanum tuberosum]|nr:hypothetical protein KY289_011799 [Solanum tuberosum]KAH0735564.1 hypothetical protein KY285_011271 [Solanum tuberosum]